MDRRIVFLDIDGTLINDRQELPDSARAAVVAAREIGHLVFLSSGRSTPEIYPWLLDVGFDGVVGGGGSFAEVGGVKLFEHVIAEDDVAELSDFFDRSGVDYVWQSSQGIYPSAGFVDRFRQLARISTSGDVHAERSPDWSQLIEIMKRPSGGTNRVVGKGTFVAPVDASIGFADVQRKFGGRFHIVPGSLDVLGVDNGELMIIGVNKGTAAREVAKHLGIPFEHTIALGDSDNDIEMIRDCGVGVAMGNARASVTAVADWQTRDINDDGLAYAFEQLGLVG